MSADICDNGIDDNCDGQIDEGCGELPAPTGTSYFVDNTCPNNGNGSSQTCATSSGGDGPFNSLASAAAAVVGDHSDAGLFLKKGQTFPGQFTVEAYGSPGHPFTISSYGSGAKPIITGGEHNIMIYCANCGHITIDGLELTASTGERANVYILDPAHHVTVRNSYLHHSSGSGLLVYNTHDNVIEQNDLSWNPQFGVDIIKGNSSKPTMGNIVRDNRIHHNLKYGVIVADWSGSSRLDGTTTELYGNESYNNSAGIYLVHADGVKVYYNDLHDNGKDCQAVDDCPGEDYGFAVQSGSNNEIHDNRISGSHSTGIGIYGAPGDRADGNSVYRNVISGTISGAWNHDIAWQCEQGASVGSDNRVYGNVVFGEGSNFELGDSESTTSGNVASNNVFYGRNPVVFEYHSENAGWTFTNNILAGSDVPVAASGMAGGLTFLKNLYYRSAGGTLMEFNGAEYASSDIATVDPNAITADPMFVGTSSWSEFRLQQGSPAIDAGTNLVGADLGDAMDPQSAAWPPSLADQDAFGSAWELGAFVYRDCLP